MQKSSRYLVLEDFESIALSSSPLSVLIASYIETEKPGKILILSFDCVLKVLRIYFVA
jgi:hypothetical protein